MAPQADQFSIMPMGAGYTDTAVDSWGFMASDPTGSVPKTLQVANPTQTVEMGFLDEISGWGSDAWDWLGDTVVAAKDKIVELDQDAYRYTADAVKSSYETVKGAVGTVADDLSSPITGILDSATNKIILILVLAAGLIYVAGKSGAVRLNRI